MATALTSRKLLFAEILEVGAQALGLAILCDVLDCGSLQVAHEGEVLAGLGDCLLVDTQELGEPPWLSGLASSDRPLHQVPCLVPADPKDLAGARDVGLAEHVDGQPFEQDGEPGVGFGPGQAT